MRGLLRSLAASVWGLLRSLPTYGRDSGKYAFLEALPPGPLCAPPTLPKSAEAPACLRPACLLRFAPPLFLVPLSLCRACVLGGGPEFGNARVPQGPAWGPPSWRLRPLRVPTHPKSALGPKVIAVIVAPRPPPALLAPISPPTGSCAPIAFQAGDDSSSQEETGGPLGFR